MRRVTQPPIFALAEADMLDFRHGVSPRPNYELKYPPDFSHFNDVNLDAPKGGTLVLPYTWRKKGGHSLSFSAT